MHWVFIAAWASSYSEQGLISSFSMQAAHCAGICRCIAWTLGAAGFSSYSACSVLAYSSVVMAHKLSRSEVSAGSSWFRALTPCILYWLM